MKNVTNTGENYYTPGNRRHKRDFLGQLLFIHLSRIISYTMISSLVISILFNLRVTSR